MSSCGLSLLAFTISSSTLNRHLSEIYRATVTANTTENRCHHKSALPDPDIVIFQRHGGTLKGCDPTSDRGV